MTLSRREVLRRGGGAVLGGALLAALAPAAASAEGPRKNVSPDLHLLRRTGWGVRAGDVAALQSVGHEA